MIFEEIEQAALTAEVMPDGLHSGDYACYQGLCDLYHRFRTGQIDRARARIEKKQLREAHGRDSIAQKAYDCCMRRENAIRNIVSEIEKNGSDDARRIIRIMDGREAL